MFKRAKNFIKVFGALLDASEYTPDRSQRATWGDRYHANLTEDNAGLQSDRLRAISDCLDLVRNSAIGRGILERIRTIVIGKNGITPEIVTEDADFNNLVEALWREWSQDPEGNGRSNLTDVQGLLATSTITHGGIGVLLHSNGNISLVESDRFALPLGVSKNGSQQPYTVDKFGRVTQWCIVDRVDNFAQKLEYSWVGASRVLTMFERLRPDQILPHPQLATCANLLRDIDELNAFTLRQAKVQSIPACIHTRGASGSQLEFRNPRQNDRATIENKGAETFEKATGLTVIDTEGDYKTLAPATPSNTYDTFMKHNLKLVAMAIGLPYEFLALYFADGTYSSAKATMTQARESVAMRQNQIQKAILEPLLKWQIARWVALGLIPDRPVSVRWRVPSFEWMDVQDQTQTELTEVKAGLRTMADLANKRGADYESLLRSRAQEIKMVNSIAQEVGVSPSELSQIIIAGDTTQGSI